MKRNLRWGIGILISVIIAAAGCSKKAEQEQVAMPTMAETAQYTLVLKSNWTAQNHPFEYPTAGALTGPHFSGIIGTSHNAGYGIFTEGSLPTPGLEKLSEEGKHSPLDEEIRAAITAGTAGALFESDPLRNFAESIVVTFTVDTAHPMVSFVAMIAPSPDWFTGSGNINLMESGNWVTSKAMALYAYDSGGDDGTTYKASDKDINPKKPTMMSSSQHFVTNGAAVPVANISITKM